MSSNVDVNKQFAMQNVSVAVRLDANGDSMDAYRKYLESIEFMSHQLFLDASQCTGPLATDSALKFIALCRQCIERADHLIKTLPVHTVTAESEFRAANHLLPNLTLPASLPNMRSLPRPEVQISVKELSPIELAQWQNDYLVSFHKTRLEKLTPNNQMKANLVEPVLTTSYDGKYGYCTTTSDGVGEKKEERLKRLQAEADRRFSCHAGMSPDELGRRKLYTEILEYEQDVKRLMELRRKVPEKCKEPSFIVACVRAILGSSFDTLDAWLPKGVCQRAIDAVNLAISSPQASTPLSSGAGFYYGSSGNTSQSSSFQMDAGAPSLKDDKSIGSSSSSKHALDQITAALVSEVQAFLEKLETMFVVMYEDFDDEEIRYTLRDLLEDIFFQPIWPYILELFKQSTPLKEQTMYEVMRAKFTASPADLGVSEKFALCQSQTDSAHSQKSEAPPYQAVVNSFQSVINVPSPAKKLDQIVQSSQLICQCIDEFYAHSAASSPQMGADEMLPVLSYVILKTEQPRLVTECYALMEFIDEGSLMGERGYCLTSVMTAIDFLLTLSSKSSPDA